MPTQHNCKPVNERGGEDTATGELCVIRAIPPIHTQTATRLYCNTLPTQTATRLYCNTPPPAPPSTSASPHQRRCSLSPLQCLLPPPPRSPASEGAAPPLTSAMPPATTATEPCLRRRLKLSLVAGRLPIHAMKCLRQDRGMGKEQESDSQVFASSHPTPVGCASHQSMTGAA